MTDFILEKLEPRGCAYSIYDVPELIEIPQNEDELIALKELAKNHAFRQIDAAEAKGFGYTELAAWSQESDTLFCSEDDGLVLLLATSLLDGQAL